VFGSIPKREENGSVPAVMQLSASAYCVWVGGWGAGVFTRAYTVIDN
jgi:hypothetical protein